MKNNIKILRIIITLILLFLLGYFLSQKINLVTTDLGRHLENGQLILAGENFQELLHTNFYSYTEPDFPFVNHHWGSGVVFYLIQQIIGFSGLSIFYLILALGSFALVFFLTKKSANFWLAILFSFLLLPLMAERKEIRPEIFSLFFSALFLFILWSWKNGKIFFKWLWVLPLCMIFWVNLHVYFILGFLILGLFLLEIFLQEYKRKKYLQTKKILQISGIALLVSLINPFGIKILLFPFQIFENYGYSVLENQSIFFVKDYGLNNPNYNLALLIAFLALIISLLGIYKNKNQNLALNLLGIFLAVWSVLAIRNFAFLGVLALPLLAINFKNIFWRKEKIVRHDVLGISCMLIFIFGCYFNWQFLKFHSQNKGFGLKPANLSAVQFFKDNTLKGPIFNNYDVGGYLIYSLFSQEKVFVDNRPEAYSVDFFQKTYIPMQENEDIWQEELQKYGFQTIFFSRTDITPWARNFLKNRLSDSEWRIAYQDQYAIIFRRQHAD